jgi:hypothetical protein
LGGRHSVVSPNANIGREMKFHLARGQHRTEDVVSSRPRPALGGRRNFVSPKANIGREMQFHIARGQL